MFLAVGDISKLVKRIDPEIDLHGFRSSFSDWAHEKAIAPNHVIEMALGHTIKNKVERAYRRGDLFEQRVPLMKVWANYCYARPVAAGNEAEVLQLTQR